jgi:integrase
MRTRPLPPYLKVWHDKRNGKRYVQFRRRGYKTVSLPPLGSPEFDRAYQMASRNKLVIGVDHSIPGSVSAAIAAFYLGTDWAGLSDTTRGAYRPILERFRETYGEWPLRQIASDLITAYIETFRQAHVARKHLKVLRRFLRHACHDVTASIKPPSSKSNKHKSWPAAMVTRFEAHHPIGTKARLCFALAKYTGAARVDLPRLGPQDIVDGEITITRRKTSVAATIPVHPELQQIIDATPLTGFSTFLVNAIGKPYAPNDLSIQFRKWCKAAGIPPGYTLHGLRHALGDAMATAGGSLHEVAATLGHKDVRTAAHYTEEADRKRLARQASARLLAGDPVDTSTKQDQGVSDNRPRQTLRPKKP